MNKLYYGDCLTIMQGMAVNSIDLIYLDPPFNSNRAYNAIYKDETGRPLPDQIEAFCDLWILDEERERAIRDIPGLMLDNGIDHNVVKFWEVWMEALRNTNPKLLAYLSYMVERLVWMKGILKPTGSIYLHCDPTASHYIKIMMDGVFGEQNFRNEIVWSYRRWPAKQKNFQKMHDIILFYSKKKQENTFNVIYEALSAGTLKRWKGKKSKVSFEGEKRLVTQMTNLDSQGRPADDVWSIPVINSQAKERLGYPTQKPLALLERIIEASSNEGDVVLDPFCGCATTIEAAHKLRRNWIGIDIAIHAIKRVAAIRLNERCRLIEGQDYEISGIPRTLEGAIDLWERDRYHFQKWAVEEVEGFVTTRRSADGGIDGRLYFSVPDARDLKSMVLEVKGGSQVGIKDLRALRGVLEKDGALLAGLIIMRPLGATQARNFHQFMAQAGDLNVAGTLYPRMQMLSIPEILKGERFQTPAVKARRSSGQQRIPFQS